MTYAVVGCTNCSGLWIGIGLGLQDTTECPHCFTQHDTDALAPLASAMTREDAAEQRARILADRADPEGDQALSAYTREGHYAEQGERVPDMSVREGREEYLADHVDVDAWQEEHEREISERVLGPDPETTLADWQFDEDGDLRRPLDAYRFAEAVPDSREQRERHDDQVSDVVAGTDAPRLREWFETPDGQLRRPLDSYRFEAHVDERLDAHLADLLASDETPESGAESPEDAGLHPVHPGGQTPIEGIRKRDVGPRVQEWLPDVLEALQPALVDAVRDELDEREWLPGEPVPGGLVEDLLQAWVAPLVDADADAAQTARVAQRYLRDLVAYTTHQAALDAEDVDTAHVEETALAGLGERLTSLATSAGQLAGFVAVLRAGPLPVLQQRERAPVLTLSLDGDAWVNAGDSRTRQRALSALSALSQAVDVRLVYSPSLEHLLERHHAEWTADHLTSDREASRETPGAETARSSRLLDAWTAVKDLDQDGDRLRMLAALDPEDGRTTQDLLHDPTVKTQSTGTLYPYLDDLRERGLLTTDDQTPGRHTLTAEGAMVQTDLLTDDYGLRHPLQATLTEPPHVSVSTVYRAADERGEGDRPAAAEPWLAETGDADAEDGRFVEWLDGPSKILDAYGMHERLLAGKRVDGINLVDHEIPELEDGRVVYVSCFEDQMITCSQWGSSMPQLVRLPAALLSRRVVSKVLPPSTAGDGFEEAYDGQFKDRVLDVIQKASQIGWFSEDEQDYDNWLERFQGLRVALLEKVGQQADSPETEERAVTYNDLHGLMASINALYAAFGVDVHNTLRMPDPANLMKSDRRYNDFLRFLRYTVPKSSLYGIHSGPRLIQEERGEKLKQRESFELRDEDPYAELTATWGVIGPGVSEMKADIERELAKSPVREAVAEGVEDAPVLEIPVAVANEYAGIKQVVERHAERKGFATDSESIRRLVRLCESVLGTAERGASPMDVATAFLHVEQAGVGEDLGVSDLAYGLAQLPPDRVFRHLKPTQQRMLLALVTADGGLTPDELRERADVSRASWERGHRELEALDLVERVGDTLYGFLVPWWSDLLPDISEPREAATSRLSTALGAPWADAALLALVDALDLEADGVDLGQRPDWLWDPEDERGCPEHLDGILDEVPALREWRRFVEAHSGQPADRARWQHDQEDDAVRVARLGRLPPGWSADQTTLAAAD